MSAISLHAQVQFHGKYPPFDRQSNCMFTFCCAILTDLPKFCWVAQRRVFPKIRGYKNFLHIISTIYQIIRIEKKVYEKETNFLPVSRFHRLYSHCTDELVGIREVKHDVYGKRQTAARHKSMKISVFQLVSLFEKLLDISW